MRGYSHDAERYQQRLRRIEGQVRGLQRMIESDASCIDVLTQASSVTSALHGVALGLLDEHIRHCVKQAAQAGGDDAEAMITEATRAVERLLKS